MANYTLYQGDCLEEMKRIADGSVDIVITDPPYSEKVHTGMRSLQKNGRAVSTIDFQSITSDYLLGALIMCGQKTRRWIISFTDWRFVHVLEEAPPNGLEFVRFGIWVKPNGMRQLTADRPAMGWEAIAFLHKSDSKKWWHGGGSYSVFEYMTVRAGRFHENYHPTEKPVDLIIDFIEKFTDPGAIILDPFMGSGTTGVAAMRTGRDFIGIELDLGYFQIAETRIKNAAGEFVLTDKEKSSGQLGLFDDAA